MQNKTSESRARAPPRPGHGADARGPPHAMPRGLLVFPFAVGVGLTLLVATALSQTIDAVWVTVALAVGAVTAIGTVGWNLRRPATAAFLVVVPPPANAEGAEAAEGDPLANIHAVEAQGRRHRKPCPNCGTPTRTDREKCSNCGHLLLVDCKGCRTRVRLEWGVCPECGRELP